MDNAKGLVILVLFICFLGILAVYSVDPLREEGWGTKSFFGRQIIWNVVGWLLFCLLAFSDYHLFVKEGWVFYLLMLLSLGGVLIFGEGDEIGVRRWLFSQSVQPAEFAKLFLVIFLSFYMSENKEEVDSYALLLKSGMLSLLVVMLVFLEPDLGTSLTLLVVWLGALFVSGFEGKKLGVVFAGLGVFGSLGWVFLRDYQK
ncbi:MAG: FtsW/RodA/SpoVE family cell cycle protein, partial [Candidatus Caldatribacteriaceae bacterium]